MTSLLSLLDHVPGLTAIPGLEHLTTLRVLRTMRPLRLLVRNKGMMVVVEALVQTLPAVVNISAFIIVLMAIFSIIGMRLVDPTLPQTQAL